MNKPASIKGRELVGASMKRFWHSIVGHPRKQVVATIWYDPRGELYVDARCRCGEEMQTRRVNERKTVPEWA